MPRMYSASFQIPITREPQNGDIIIFVTALYGGDEYYILSSFYDGSSWTNPAADTQLTDQPTYENSKISVDLTSISYEIKKATYLTSYMN